MASPCMYNIGDRIYADTFPTRRPRRRLDIYRIEKFLTTEDGHINVEVTRFYRRCNLSSENLKLADRYCSFPALEKPGERIQGLPLEADKLSSADLRTLREKQVFMSTIPVIIAASDIRKKCTVKMLAPWETACNYFGREDFLLLDRKIRLGPKFQADVPPLEECQDKEELDDRDERIKLNEPWTPEVTEREELVCHPHHGLGEAELQQFFTNVVMINNYKQGKPMDDAPRDAVYFHGFELLHKADYDTTDAEKHLVAAPEALDEDNNDVVKHQRSLVTDPLNRWRQQEVDLLTQGISMLGKDFLKIRCLLLPWKALDDIVEFYFIIKTLEPYRERRKRKWAKIVDKIRQIYIPARNLPQPSSPKIVVLEEEEDGSPDRQ
ncbi:hypothetical protein L596_028630 [Steinernema carpocapsae]|uniref:SANT domain-containing protein n=1 Tax=Steinernema carpocapsae TaxID=34508 RepID=A0A4U5LZ32_STECR|nr:hypothetical protein L596_028630 [Steinernema carpocapsae]